MNNFISLSSLAMDLKRVAMGYHKNSIAVADRFLQEAVKRDGDIDPNNLKPYLSKLLGEVRAIDKIEDNQIKAEKALLLSILFQNAALNISR